MTLCLLITFLVRSDSLPSAHPYEEPAYEVYKMEGF